MPGRASRRVDTASRVIHAPAMAIYGAFVDAAALAAWLPPDGMTGAVEVLEPREGGRLRMILTYPAEARSHGKATADEDIVEARFAELRPGERIVQLVNFESDDPSYGGTMRMTWSFAAVDGGTQVTVAAEDVPPGISAEDHEAAMASTLENLAQYVE